MEGAGYRLIVIHDDPGARYLIDALTLSLGIQCEAFSSAEEFLACFRPSLAGCLLTDLHLKNMSGLELQDALTLRGSNLPIVFVGDSVDVATAVRAMKNGAVTVLERPYRTAELIEAIRGGLQINRKARELDARHADVRRRLESLTAQERRVLEMIIEGTPNKCIKRVFGVSQRTIARVRARVYAKMCVESAFELARIVAPAGALPAIDSQRRSLLNGKELRTRVAEDDTDSVSFENGGRQANLRPPHFQQDQRRMPSGNTRQKPLGPDVTTGPAT